MPNRIEPMAQKAFATKGMEHNTWISLIRTYISYHPTSDIIAEINQITDKTIFNTLLEVGLKTPLREALEKRWIKIQ